MHMSDGSVLTAMCRRRSVGVMSTKKREATQVGPIEWRQLEGTAYAVPAKITMRTENSPRLPYIVEVTVENRTGQPECTKLVFERRPDGPPVTTERLRRVPVRDLTVWAAEGLLMMLNDPEKGVEAGVRFPTSREEVAATGEAIERDTSRGRRRITDYEMRAFVDLYVRANASGRSYIAAAGVEMGLTTDQARQWKRKAVRQGLLEGGQQ